MVCLEHLGGSFLNGGGSWRIYLVISRKFRKVQNKSAKCGSVFFLVDKGNNCSIELYCFFFVTSLKARRCPWKNKIEEKNKKFFFLNFEFILAFNTPWAPISVHKRFKPNRYSRLAGYTQHIRVSCFNI